MPVIILGDQFLADSEKTISELEAEKIEIDRGKIELEHDSPEEYRRYELTEDGISPALIPGAQDQVVLVDSDEHDEAGHIIEDAEMRIRMMKKRMKKLEKIREEMQKPAYFGSENPDFILVGWGSTCGPLHEVLEKLENKGYKPGLFAFSDIWPLPGETGGKDCKNPPGF